MYKKVGLVLLVVLALIASACSGGDDDKGDESSTPTTEGDSGNGGEGEGWTVLVYSMADNNLEEPMLADITEMAAVGSGDGLNIIDLVDRSVAESDAELLDVGSFTGAKLLKVNKDSAEVLEELGEDYDSGDPANLAGFITRGIQEYPAAHYSLIISDHGAAWPGVGPDDSSTNMIDLAELQDAISTGLSDAGVEKLDLLGFDACLMSTYEVASVLAPYADRLIASGEKEPGTGWDYHALQGIVDDPSIDVDTLGTAIVDGFQAQSEEAGQGADITLALLDLTKIDALDTAMSDFASALTERTAEVAPTVGRVVATVESYGKDPDPAQDSWSRDLGALAAQIGIDALDVSDQADAVQTALNDMVVHKVQGPQAPDFTGMAIYFPPTQDLANGDYQTIPDSGAGWVDFLVSYWNAGAAIPEEEQPTFTTEDATVTFDDEGFLNIEGTFDLASQENLASATIRYGLVLEDGSVQFIGEEPGVVSDDGSGLASASYDQTVLKISDGEDEAYAYLALTTPDPDSDGFVINVPMTYYADGNTGEGATPEDALLEIVVDGEQNVTQETYYLYEESGSLGVLTPEEGAIVVPKILTVDAEGNQEWTPTTDVGLFADLPNLQYDLPKLDSGTQLYVQLSVTDFGGNTDEVHTVVTIP